MNEAKNTGLSLLMGQFAALTVAGIPAPVYAWCVFIALLNDIDTSGVTERDVSKIAARILLDALIAGWAAVYIVAAEVFKEYNLENVGMSIVAGVVVFFMPWLRRVVPPLAVAIVGSSKDLILDAVARWVGSRMARNGDLSDGDQK